MLHDVLIGVHTVAAVVCFAAGLVAVRPSVAPAWYPLYLGSLVVMLLFMVGAIAVDWPGLDATARVIYSGLIGLGAYILWRACHAGVRLSRRGRGWQVGYLDDVGFTLIALFNAFVIVAAIDLGAPVWLVVALGVAGGMAGAQAVRYARGWLAARRPGRPVAR